MVYLDPKSDIAFKKLFGDITHKNILMSFLNSVLEREEGEMIVDVVMNDTHNVPETPLSKASIVDVRCTDQKNHQYIIEMQVMTQEDYAARAQYYSALALSRQLASGERYRNLVPVIFVGILDFNLFKGKHYLSHHLILETETHAHELKHLEFHFIELTKFDKTLEQSNNILDTWIYMFKNATTLEKVPQTFKEPVVHEAFDVLAQSNWSKKELEAYDRYLDGIRSAVSQLDTAHNAGVREGIEKGLEEGVQREKREIARALLDVLDVETIAKKTGLSIDEIKQLKK